MSRQAKPKAEAEPVAPVFRMIVTAPKISIGPRDAVEGEEIEVGAQARASLLFWRRARDA